MSCLFQDDILEGGEEQTNGHRKQGRQTEKSYSRTGRGPSPIWYLPKKSKTNLIIATDVRSSQLGDRISDNEKDGDVTTGR